MSTQKKAYIYLVEDDQSFGAVLKSYLEINDYQVTWVDDGKYAVERFRNSMSDLCILDVMLPNVDGFMIASQIRKINTEIPFIFLTARALREDILKGYNLGADDYITKPFDTEVLICKIKAILKRTGSLEQIVIREYEIGNYRFNYPLRQISGMGNVRKLSPKESELLRLLCENKNKLLPRDLALSRIWGDEGYFTARSMDVFVTHLRKYLSGDPRIEIQNLHGSGFILVVPD